MSANFILLCCSSLLYHSALTEGTDGGQLARNEHCVLHGDVTRCHYLQWLCHRGEWLATSFVTSMFSAPPMTSLIFPFPHTHTNLHCFEGVTVFCWHQLPKFRKTMVCSVVVMYVRKYVVVMHVHKYVVVMSSGSCTPIIRSDIPSCTIVECRQL